MGKFITLLILWVSLPGCATKQALGIIENHDKNMEAALSNDSGFMEWVSSPGYSGKVAMPEVHDCDATDYFVLTGFFGSTLAPLSKEFQDIRWKPLQTSLSNTLSELKACGVLISANPSCRGNCFSSAPVTIEFIDNSGKLLYAFSPPKRESVPIKNWPEVAISAIVDIPFSIVILAFSPLLLLDE